MSGGCHQLAAPLVTAIVQIFRGAIFAPYIPQMWSFAPWLLFGLYVCIYIFVTIGINLYLLNVVLRLRRVLFPRTPPTPNAHPFRSSAKWKHINLANALSPQALHTTCYMYILLLCIYIVHHTMDSFRQHVDGLAYTHCARLYIRHTTSAVQRHPISNGCVLYRRLLYDDHPPTSPHQKPHRSH